MNKGNVDLGREILDMAAIDGKPGEELFFIDVHTAEPICVCDFLDSIDFFNPVAISKREREDERNCLAGDETIRR